MKYHDTTIDEAILRALYINKTITFNTLLEKAGRIRGKNYNRHSKKYEIARGAFNSHIKNLVKQDMIDKDDHGRGKPVEYFLTYKAKQQIRLKFFDRDSKLNKNGAFEMETKEKRENMYLLLFFVLKDEQEMYDFLSSVNIHNKGAQHMFDRRYAVEHMGLTKEELEEAFTLLKSEGLIDSIKKENNDNHQILYKIKDKSLYDLINDHLILAMYVRLKLILIWSYIRKPTIEETKWFESFFTRKDFYATFGFTTENRNKIHKTIKRKQRFEKIKEELAIVQKHIANYITKIKETHTNTTNKYRFPADDLIKKIYPEFLQKSVMIKKGFVSKLVTTFTN